MMTTKRLLLSAAICLSSFAAQAQDAQNVVKLDVVSLLAISQLNLNYERVIDPRKTLNVQIGWGWGSDLTKTFQTQIDANKTSNPYDIELRKFNYDGAFQIAPEFRFYIGDAEGPHGFYVAPQLNYSSYSFTASGDHQYTLPSGTVMAIDQVKLNYTAIGGGLQLGAQWLFNNRIALDWGFLGIGLVSGTVTATGTSTDNAQLDKWATDAAAWSGGSGDINGFTKFLGFKTENNQITASGSQLFPTIRSTISLGYAF